MRTDDSLRRINTEFNKPTTTRQQIDNTATTNLQQNHKTNDNTIKAPVKGAIKRALSTALRFPLRVALRPLQECSMRRSMDSAIEHHYIRLPRRYSAEHEPPVPQQTAIGEARMKADGSEGAAH